MKKRVLLFGLIVSLVMTSMPVYANPTVSDNEIEISAETGAEESEPSVNGNVLGDSISENTALDLCNQIDLDEQFQQLLLQNAKKFSIEEYYGDDEIAAEKGANDAKYDPRPYNRVTAPKNQGATGMCWAYSAIAAMESNLIIKGYENNNVDLSEYHLAYMLWKYFPLKDKINPSFCDYIFKGANHYRLHFMLLNKVYGPIYEAQAPMPNSLIYATSIPYDLKPNIDPKYDTEHAYRVNSIFYDRILSRENIKAMISEFGGVAVGYNHDSSLHDSIQIDRFYETGKRDLCYYTPNEEGDSHGVEIIGWDDNYPISNFHYAPPGKGAWLVKNSWYGAKEIIDLKGTGYWWISYYEPSLDNQYVFAYDMLPNQVDSSGVKVDISSIHLNKGDSFQIEASVEPDYANNQNVLYSSSRPEIATVSSTGVVTAKDYGTTFIEIKAADGKSPSQWKVVKVYADSIKLSEDKLSMSYAVGKTPATHALELFSNSGDSLNNNTNVKWSSSNERVATVSSKGIVTPKGVGNAIITASINDEVVTNSINLTASCEVEIKEIASSISIGVYPSNVTVGNQWSISSVIVPSSLSKMVRYTSSDSSIASVSSGGLVSFNKAGVVTIKAETTDGSYLSASAIFHVYDKPTSIQNTDNSLTLFTNDSYQLNVKVLPSSAYQGVIYSVEDESILSVTREGKCTALKSGSTNLVLESDQMNSLSKIIPVTIYDKTKDISFSFSNDTYEVGQSFNLFALAVPSTANNKFEYLSSNTSVASVTSSGKVTIVGKGTATITVKATDGSNVIKSVQVRGEILPKGVSVAQKNIALFVGEDATIDAKITNEDATNRALKYIACDTDVITVDSDGKVTAVGVGETDVIVYAEADSTVYNTVNFMVQKGEIISITADNPEKCTYSYTQSRQYFDTYFTVLANDMNLLDNVSVSSTNTDVLGINKVEKVLQNKNECKLHVRYQILNPGTADIVVITNDGPNNEQIKVVTNHELLEDPTKPSVSPVSPSVSPSVTTSEKPSANPSVIPSISPSIFPSTVPSILPTVKPSGDISTLPDEFAVDNITYENVNGKLWVLGVSSSARYLTVGEIVYQGQKYSVYGIKNEAFAGSQIKQITLTGDVKEIGENAFLDCKQLTKVTMNKGLIRIGEYAFSGCSKLSSVKFSGTVQSIDEGAFYGCYKIKKVVIPDSVRTIGQETFYGCRNLTQVTIGKKVKTIRKSCFAQCKKLRTVIIKSTGLKKVERNSFKNCAKKMVVNVPKKKLSKYKKLFKKRLTKFQTISGR